MEGEYRMAERNDDATTEEINGVETAPKVEEADNLSQEDSKEDSKDVDMCLENQMASQQQEVYPNKALLKSRGFLFCWLGFFFFNISKCNKSKGKKKSYGIEKRKTNSKASHKLASQWKSKNDSRASYPTYERSQRSSAG